jgi:xanthine dehydrogenase YagS FAD-binding subunit
MKKFSWYEAKSIEDAMAKVNATSSDILGKEQDGKSVVFKAGGIDLLDLMKEGLVNPSTIVGVKSIPNLDKIEYSNQDGLHIGANATLGELEESSLIKEKYLALHLAVAHAGTPQLRNSATLGGNLAQRNRCWYFRSIDHECYRKGSGTCYAQKGENEFHAIMNNGTCASVHASSVATALLAFDAKVHIATADGKLKEVPMEEFFVHPEDDSRNETILKAGDLITGVTLPASQTGTKSYYIKFGARESHDWALADVAVVAILEGRKYRNASVALGAAAPVPIKSKAAAEKLIGKSLNKSVAKAAAKASMIGATPLAKNAYKVPVFHTIVERAISKLS